MHLETGKVPRAQRCCETLSGLGTRCFQVRHTRYFSLSKPKSHWIKYTILFAEINFILCKWLWVILQRLLCIRPWDLCGTYCLQMCLVPSGDSLEPALCLPHLPYREHREALGKTHLRPERSYHSTQLLEHTRSYTNTGGYWASGMRKPFPFFHLLQNYWSFSSSSSLPNYSSVHHLICHLVFVHM